MDKKFVLSLLLYLSSLITMTTLIVYTTDPGLHYLLILYDALALTILGFIALIINYKSKIVLLSVFGTAVLTFLPIIIDGHLNYITISIGLYASIAGLIAHFYSLWYLYKRPLKRF